MPRQCPACQLPFSKSGFKHHKRLTKDLLCQRYWANHPQSSDSDQDLHSDSQWSDNNSDALSSEEGEDVDNGDLLPEVLFGPAVEQDEAKIDGEAFVLGIDPAGDALGDYDLLEDDDIDMESDKSYEGDLEETDEEWDVEEANIRLEPHRQPRQIPENSSRENSAEEDADLQAAQLRRDGAERQLQYAPHIVGFPGAAGKPVGRSGSQNDAYASGIPAANNPYYPFGSRMDWEVARWAKVRGPGSTALTELLQIPGVPESLGLSFRTSDELNEKIDKRLPGRPRFVRHEVLIGNEVCEVFYRDVIACVRAIFGNPDFTPYLVFAPEKHYTDPEKTRRMYHDMHTGRWWWATQVCDGLVEWLTEVLMVMMVQEEVEREKPGATIIPIIISTDKTQLTLFRNKTAYPVYLTIGNIPKEIRRKPSSRAYVLLAYLPTTKLEFVSNKAARRRMIANLYHVCMKKILQPLEKFGISGLSMATGSGVEHRVHPIFACFVGDYPEQILVALGYTGKCACCKIAHAKLGDYAPKCATDLRDLAAILDILDSFDTCPEDFLKSCAAAGVKPVIDPFWLNFPYTHIFRSITPDVLHQLYQGIVKHLVAWLIEAYGAAEIDARCRRIPPITTFESLKTGLARSQSPCCPLYLGIREHFNLPKLHFALHYSQSIRLFGTTDNFNTEYTERLHIDFTKDAYRSTNRKDEFAQMTVWLERREKVHRHAQFVEWRLNQSGIPPKPRSLSWSPPGLDLNHRLHLAKRPSVMGVTVEGVVADYGARFFKAALARFIALTNQPEITRTQLERAVWDIHLPFRKVRVWHRIKFLQEDPCTRKLKTVDSIHAQPSRTNSQKKLIPGRFDTALVNDGSGGLTGIKGYHVGRVRLVFSLPPAARRLLFTHESAVPTQLAYVEWYTKLRPRPEADHLLYKISPLVDDRGDPICSIVAVKDIRQSAHLFPKFGPSAPSEWTSSNVLDLCQTFYINSFSNKFMYRTMY
ncbi:hypothetical protein BC835DRAFT_1455506 [Cytidiella melzeri]|nr:hypothetical protein BC835DRAFT_1455506 [Cytidiella melzeri]